MGKFIDTSFDSFINKNYDHKAYLSWKRKNITLRGMSNVGEENNKGALMGAGLYTAALSNREMSRQYGTVYFVLNGIPKNPKILNSINDWEIWSYNTVIYNYCINNNLKVSRRTFNEHTSIEKEIQNLGYDGVIITGREMVNYTPKDVKYFKTESELIDYYETFIL